MQTALLSILLLLPPHTLGALLPGFDEELFCPPGTCLRPRTREPGYCGQRSEFHECFDPSGGAIRHPRSWGVKVGEEFKAELLRDGWHEQECDRHDARNDTQKCEGMKANLGSMASRLVNRLDTIIFKLDS